MHFVSSLSFTAAAPGVKTPLARSHVPFVPLSLQVAVSLQFGFAPTLHVAVLYHALGQMWHTWAMQRVAGSTDDDFCWPSGQSCVVDGGQVAVVVAGCWVHVVSSLVFSASSPGANVLPAGQLVRLAVHWW